MLILLVYSVDISNSKNKLLYLSLMNFISFGLSLGQHDFFLNQNHAYLTDNLAALSLKPVNSINVNTITTQVKSI